MSKLWGGRFREETDNFVNIFNASIDFDQRLWRVDLLGSKAHVKMLGECGIIQKEEAMQILSGLDSVEEGISSGDLQFTRDAEDVHMNVEIMLRDKIGPVAGKLHTGRSRNDQVATDLRLWLRSEVDEISSRVCDIQSQLIKIAEEHIDTILPGLTHMQHAQPVRLAHHMMAYFWMLDRDRERITDARIRINTLPLGSGALAGTTFPIDRNMVARDLGFDRISENSMDAVSDRDFVAETLSLLSLIAVHLSRLSEELILWNSQEFGFVQMGDTVTTGSSIMPQKKNPDVAELVRGKTGRVFGDLLSCLTMLKGLPLTYNKDMQEDKEPLFDAVDTVVACLTAMWILLRNCRFNTSKMSEATRGDFSTATDLADFLVEQSMPFRSAHEIVGQIVAHCETENAVLEDLTIDDLASFHPLFQNAPKDIASPLRSVERRQTPGGVSKQSVLAQIMLAKARLYPEESS